MKAKFTIVLSVLLCMLLLKTSAQAAKKISIYKNIAYWDKDDRAFDPEEHILDIYTPANATEANPSDVFVFIHGGSWNHGDKKLYSLIGRNMARKGKVAVIINYRLTPKAKYEEILEDCAKAVSWVHDNIARYQGNPERITVSGHSAGGHLAASLMVTDVFSSKLGIENPIKGCVLIDAFGLDLYSYLMKYKTPSDLLFYRTFTDQPEAWKSASPFYALQKTSVPFLVFAGSETYPPIIDDSRKFTARLNELGCCASYSEIKGKKHAAMIVQMFWRRNQMYNQILSFMDSIPQNSPEQLSLNEGVK